MPTLQQRQLTGQFLPPSSSMRLIRTSRIDRIGRHRFSGALDGIETSTVRLPAAASREILRGPITAGKKEGEKRRLKIPFHPSAPPFEVWMFPLPGDLAWAHFSFLTNKYSLSRFQGLNEFGLIWLLRTQVCKSHSSLSQASPPLTACPVPPHLW